MTGEVFAIPYISLTDGNFELFVYSYNVLSLTCCYNLTPKWDLCITVTKGGGIISCQNALCNIFDIAFLRITGEAVVLS